MQSQEKDKKSKKKISKTAVLEITIAVAIVAYIAISLLTPEKPPEMKTLYCRFEVNISDEYLPRYECAILKIVTPNLDDVNISALESLNASIGCSWSLDELDGCDAETYHFTDFPLNLFCEEQPCDAEGVVCGAYAITYYSNSSVREFYEDSRFKHKNITKQELEMRLMECDLDGE